jgi:hypothetical protein
VAPPEVAEVPDAPPPLATPRFEPELEPLVPIMMAVPDEAAPLPEPLPPLVGGGSAPELLPVDVAPVPVGGRGCGFRPQSDPTTVAKAAASSSAIARLVLVTPMAPGPFKHTMCQLRNVAEVAERSTMRRNLPMTADPRMAQLGTPCSRPLVGPGRACYPLGANAMAQLDDHQPSEAEASSPRVRRTLELAYAVEGVVAVRIWRGDSTSRLACSAAHRRRPTWFDALRPRSPV